MTAPSATENASHISGAVVVSLFMSVEVRVARADADDVTIAKSEIELPDVGHGVISLHENRLRVVLDFASDCL